MDITKLKYGVIGICTTVIGGWHLTLQILFILMAVDVVTGVFKGLYLCDFNSKAFRQGLVTKGGFILVLILCFQMDLLMGNTEPVIRTICATFYIAIEGSSIVENLGMCGVRIPSFIGNRLTKLKEMADRGDTSPDETTEK